MHINLFHQICKKTGRNRTDLTRSQQEAPAVQNQQQHCRSDTVRNVHSSGAASIITIRFSSRLIITLFNKRLEYSGKTEYADSASDTH